MSDLNKIISEEGLDNLLVSLFPNLAGIEFDNIKYDKDLQDRNPLLYMTSDIDGGWYFGVGSMAMIFKAVSKENEINELNKILLSNQIPLDSVYTVKGQEGIQFWNGNGFKVEKTSVEGVSVILITNANVSPESAKTFLETDLADEVKHPNWIRNLGKVYDSSSVNTENKSLSNFINVPLLFDEESEYILINVQTAELGRIIIDRIILENGGFDSFSSELAAEWEYLFRGYLFVVGYLPEQRSVRINKLPPTSRPIGEKVISSNCILPITDKLQSNILGFDRLILSGEYGGVKDGRFVSYDEESTVITSFFEEPKKAIDFFKRIVSEYNDSDEFLTIKARGIVKWFEEEPEDVITFDISDKFRLDLSKGQSSLRINLYPPGGIYGSWNDLNEQPYEGDKPVVNFSQFSKELKTVESETEEKEDLNEELSVKEGLPDKKTFLEESIDESDENEDVQIKNKKSDRNSLNWIWIILGILLLFLLLKTCNRDKNYYFENGNNQLEKGNNFDAIESYNDAIEIDAEYIDAILARGQAYSNTEDYNNAIFDYNSAISLDENNWEAYYLRGRAYLSKAKNKFSVEYKKAISDFTQSIELNPDYSDSYYYRGLTKQKSIDEKAGCDDYLSALQLGNDKASSVYNNLCYPKTGFMPYEKHFGNGVHTGKDNLTFNLSNWKYDVVVIVVNASTNRPIRSQFIRSGDILVMKNIPKGRYYIKEFGGNDWSSSLILPDGISKGGFLNNTYVEKSFYKKGKLISPPTEITYGVSNGNETGESITFDEFFKK